MDTDKAWIWGSNQALWEAAAELKFPITALAARTGGCGGRRGNGDPIAGPVVPSSSSSSSSRPGPAARALYITPGPPLPWRRAAFLRDRGWDRDRDPDRDRDQGWGPLTHLLLSGWLFSS